jgi:hypothetical protein
MLDIASPPQVRLVADLGHRAVSMLQSIGYYWYPDPEDPYMIRDVAKRVAFTRASESEWHSSHVGRFSTRASGASRPGS